MSKGNLGLNLKPGINYVTCRGKLGFRGVSTRTKTARLIPLSEPKETKDQMFCFFGVDVDSALLPYSPDMSPGSAFKKAGSWHRFQIQWGIFVDFLVPNGPGSFSQHHVLRAVMFAEQTNPTIFLDLRDKLQTDGLLRVTDIQTIEAVLARKSIAIP